MVRVSAEQLFDLLAELEGSIAAQRIATGELPMLPAATDEPIACGLPADVAKTSTEQTSTQSAADPHVSRGSLSETSQPRKP